METRRGRQPALAATIRLVAITCAPVLLVTACSKTDGRMLRDPSPDQTASVSMPTTTMAPESTQVVDSTMDVVVPWTDGEAIDPRHTCDGVNVSPPLAWSGAPTGTAAYAVVLTDLDAPEFAHWVVANIPADRASIPENFTDPLVVFADNSQGRAGYAGPCPTKGENHTYDVTVYALSQVLEAQNGDPAPGLIAAIEAASVDSASSVFTYSR